MSTEEILKINFVFLDNDDPREFGGIICGIPEDYSMAFSMAVQAFYDSCCCNFEKLGYDPQGFTFLFDMELANFSISDFNGNGNRFHYKQDIILEKTNQRNMLTLTLPINFIVYKGSWKKSCERKIPFTLINYSPNSVLNNNSSENEMHLVVQAYESNCLMMWMWIPFFGTRAFFDPINDNEDIARYMVKNFHTSYLQEEEAYKSSPSQSCD